MIELLCNGCSAHLGWRTDCGPGPSYYCDDCKDAEDEEAEADRLSEEE